MLYSLHALKTSTLSSNNFLFLNRIYSKYLLPIVLISKELDANLMIFEKSKFWMDYYWEK